MPFLNFQFLEDGQPDMLDPPLMIFCTVWFSVLFHCLIVCVCVSCPWPYMIYFMARYSPFLLKVPVNTNRPNCALFQATARIKNTRAPSPRCHSASPMFFNDTCLLTQVISFSCRLLFHWSLT